MKKVGFIGGYDKVDLVIYVAKILNMAKYKVLVIDTTSTEKSRYIIPVMNPSKEYVTEYDEIDIAVGFSKMEDIKKYLGLSEKQEMEYDFVLIDTDNESGFKKFDIETADKSYFVTSFDSYSLKKGLETLNAIQKNITLTKVLFAKEVLKEDDDYLNFLSLGYKNIWNPERIYFPIENGDLTVIYENQRFAKIKFKKLSVQYKDGLSYIAMQILGDGSESKVRRVMKIIEKGV